MSEFDAAASRFARAVRDGTAGDQADLESLTLGLVRLVAARSLLTEHEREDVVAVAIEEFVRAVQKPGFDEKRAPALLTTIAKRRTIDGIRRQKRWGRHLDWEPPALASSDDRIAAILDHDATAIVVVDAMRLAWEAGHRDVVLIVRQWLDLAQELGRAPTTREAATRSGCSHTQIRRALAAFSEFVPRP